MKRLFKIKCRCKCTGDCWFTFFTIICLLLGLSELVIGGILHTIRFNHFVTDEWFTEFFAVTCGVLVIVISGIGLYVQSVTYNIQEKFRKYTYVLSLSIFYQGLSCLVFSLPILYRNIYETLPEHIPGSQIHRPTFERLIYIRVMITINLISITHFFIGIIYWLFTLCYSNSSELEEKEMNYFRHSYKDRGKFAENNKKSRF